MARRNPSLAALGSRYLFAEIAERKRAFLKEHPDADLIDLGIGNTTRPIPSHITGEMEAAAARLGTKGGYIGYGPSEGLDLLRQKIAEEAYGGALLPEELFISDGAKCDLGRLQLLFHEESSIAIQDPAYPVYVDSSLLYGKSAEKIVYLPCTPENEFFPEIENIPQTDLIYICSPNNPTGAAASKKRLSELVAFAKKNRSIILFDAAYSAFIRDPGLPKSIYEIEGAKEVAIEVNSFSKMAGFTGVRLGWTAVPKELAFEGGASLHSDWERIISTLFNGPSLIAQSGGLAVFDPIGKEAVHQLALFYMKQAMQLSASLGSLGFQVYGGSNAPYLWVEFKGKRSWEIFHYFLEEHRIITTPGVGFGPCGEGFIRISAFATAQEIDRALERLARESRAPL